MYTWQNFIKFYHKIQIPAEVFESIKMMVLSVKPVVKDLKNFPTRNKFAA